MALKRAGLPVTLENTYDFFSSETLITKIMEKIAEVENDQTVDDAKNYHDTDSFGRDDLPLVAKLADQAHTFIFERLAKLKSEQSE